MAPNLLVAMTSAVQPLNPRRLAATPLLNGVIDLDAFCRKQVDCSGLSLEHWNTPVPGYYAHVSGKGWYLVQRDIDLDEEERLFFCKPHSSIRPRTIRRETSSSIATSSHSSTSSAPSRSSSVSTYITAPEPVIYSHILHKYILAREMQSRLRWTRAVNPSSSNPFRRARKERLGFFQLDDGFSWVIAYGRNGMEDREPDKRLWVLEKGEDGEKKMRLMTGEEWRKVSLKTVTMERY